MVQLLDAAALSLWDPLAFPPLPGSRTGDSGTVYSDLRRQE